MQSSPTLWSFCGVLFLACIVGACAFTDEDITLTPTSQVPATDVGRGTSVAVKVTDERPSALIGHRGPMRTADIRATADVAQVVDDAVRQGLRNQGFKPLEPGTAPRSLLIEVRALSYETSAGFFSGGIHTRALLKARANRPGDSYEQVYRSENEERIMVVPTEASDSEQINRALSVAIDQMLADQRLLSFLADRMDGDAQAATQAAGITPIPIEVR